MKKEQGTVIIVLIIFKCIFCRVELAVKGGEALTFFIFLASFFYINCLEPSPFPFAVSLPLFTNPSFLSLTVFVFVGFLLYLQLILIHPRCPFPCYNQFSSKSVHGNQQRDFLIQKPCFFYPLLPFKNLLVFCSLMLEKPTQRSWFCETG